eukprot:2653435-Amphidinium_carterae.1
MNLVEPVFCSRVFPFQGFSFLWVALGLSALQQEMGRIMPNGVSMKWMHRKGPLWRLIGKEAAAEEVEARIS